MGKIRVGFLYFSFLSVCLSFCLSVDNLPSSCSSSFFVPGATMSIASVGCFFFFFKLGFVSETISVRNYQNLDQRRRLSFSGLAISIGEKGDDMIFSLSQYSPLQNLSEFTQNHLVL